MNTIEKLNEMYYDVDKEIVIPKTDLKRKYQEDPSCDDISFNEWVDYSNNYWKLETYIVDQIFNQIRYGITHAQSWKAVDNIVNPMGCYAKIRENLSKYDGISGWDFNQWCMEIWEKNEKVRKDLA